MRRQDKESKVFKARDRGVRGVPRQQVRHERRIQRRRRLAGLHLEKYRAGLEPAARQPIRLNVFRAIRDHLLKIGAEAPHG